jgi:hypothetical protein
MTSPFPEQIRLRYLDIVGRAQGVRDTFVDWV